MFAMIYKNIYKNVFICFIKKFIKTTESNSSCFINMSIFSLYMPLRIGLTLLTAWRMWQLKDTQPPNLLFKDQCPGCSPAVLLQLSEGIPVPSWQMIRHFLPLWRWLAIISGPCVDPGTSSSDTEFYCFLFPLSSEAPLSVGLVSWNILIGCPFKLLGRLGDSLSIITFPTLLPGPLDPFMCWPILSLLHPGTE